MATLTDARDLDWQTAKEQAQRIIRVCDDAGFTAPEALDVFRGKIQQVAESMNAIARALLMTGGSR